MPSDETIKLPAPKLKSAVSLEQSLAARRSVREFTDQRLTTAEIGQLLWAAQGISEKTMGLRTTPSAGALNPLEIYVALPEAFYRYQPCGHKLLLRKVGDQRPEIQKRALGQEAIGEAPAVFIMSGVLARTAVKYGHRATRYIHIEAGHAGQNLLLQATALGLAGVPMGAFHDEEIARALGMAPGEMPVYIVPVGYPR